MFPKTPFAVHVNTATLLSKVKWSEITERSSRPACSL